MPLIDAHAVKSEATGQTSPTTGRRLEVRRGAYAAPAKTTGRLPREHGQRPLTYRG